MRVLQADAGEDCRPDDGDGCAAARDGEQHERREGVRAGGERRREPALVLSEQHREQVRHGRVDVERDEHDDRRQQRHQRRRSRRVVALDLHQLLHHGAELPPHGNPGYRALRPRTQEEPLEHLSGDPEHRHGDDREPRLCRSPVDARVLEQPAGLEERLHDRIAPRPP